MSQDNKTTTVLVAEDHKEMRSCIVNVLKREFCVIGAVANGQQLVHAATRLQPHVIVSDVLMPGLNGPDAREVLRNSSVEIPFVFVTSDCKLAAHKWRDLGACISKLRLLEHLCPAVHSAAQGSDEKGLAEPGTCDSAPGLQYLAS